LGHVLAGFAFEVGLFPSFFHCALPRESFEKPRRGCFDFFLTRPFFRQEILWLDRLIALAAPDVIRGGSTYAGAQDLMFAAVLRAREKSAEFG
jgi:hypothetical protein